MNNQNFEQFKTDFKRDTLVKIVVLMKHGKTNKTSAKDLAKQIIYIFKNSDQKVMFAAINKLCERHTEILDIFIKRGYEFDEREKAEKLNQIVLYLKEKGGDKIN